MNSLVVSLVLSLFVLGSSSEKIGFDGTCPEVSFVEDFDSAKFFGKWFSVKETGKEIPCVNYDIEETRPNHYHGYVFPQNQTIEFDKKNVENFSEGLKVSFLPNSYINDGVFKVFSTDYSKLVQSFQSIWVKSKKTQKFIFYFSFSQLRRSIHLQRRGRSSLSVHFLLVTRTCPQRRIPDSFRQCAL